MPGGDPPMRVRIGAIVVNELGVPLRDVRRQVGDPPQIVELAVPFGDRFLPVVGEGPFGEVLGVCLITTCRILKVPYPPPLEDLMSFILVMVFSLFLTILFPPFVLWLGHMA